jgi:hypothetical protein
MKQNNSIDAFQPCVLASSPCQQAKNFKQIKDQLLEMRLPRPPPHRLLRVEVRGEHQRLPLLALPQQRDLPGPGGRLPLRLPLRLQAGSRAHQQHEVLGSAKTGFETREREAI